MLAPLVPDHPFRDAVLAELHARPVDLLDNSVRVRRVVLIVSARLGSMREAIEAYCEFAARKGYRLQSDARRFAFATASRSVTWEFHTEFITVTWRSSLADTENWPSDIGLEVLRETKLVGAMRVDMIDEAELPERALTGFSTTSLCLVTIEYGKAQLATDFIPDPEKFIRFEFAAHGLSPLRRAIMLRRILEIETYRTMALLALPLARETAPALRAAEIELTALIEGLSDLVGIDEVKGRLYALHALFVRTGQISEKLHYRFAASRAYGAILQSRLEKLREVTLGRGSSLTSFLGNRVEPALATCDAMDKRLAVLSEKLARSIDMLDVRIGLDIQIQNKAVLEAIAQTARSHLRLQHMVEGISTIAITYYLLGILNYALSGPLGILGWDKAWTISIAAPFALAVVWLGLKAAKRGVGQGPIA